MRAAGRTAGPCCWERSRSSLPAAPVHTPQVWPNPPKYRPRQGPRRRPGPSLPRRERVARRPRAGSKPRFQPEPRHVNGPSRDTPRAVSGGAPGPSRRRRHTRPHSPWRPAAPASLPASTVLPGATTNQSAVRSHALPAAGSDQSARQAWGPAALWEAWRGGRLARSMTGDVGPGRELRPGPQRRGSAFAAGRAVGGSGRVRGL